MKTGFNFLIVVLLLFSGCGKDDETITQTCEDFPESTSFDGYDYITKPNMVASPCFNPNNPQELCFSRIVNPSYGIQKTELWKTNLATGQQQMLYDNIQGQPDWGKNNWILFEFGSLMHMIKGDGDSLTHFVVGEYGHNPKWLSSSGLFLQNISDIRNRSSNIVERSPDGLSYKCLELKDPGISKWLSNFAISPDGSKIVATIGDNGQEAFYVFEYSSLKGELLQKLDPAWGESVIGRAWHTDNIHIFWSNNHGIYKTNVVTKQTWQLKTGCSSRLYLNLSVSPDGQTLAADRIDRKKLTGNNVEQELSIYLMDTNGNNERKLEL